MIDRNKLIFGLGSLHHTVSPKQRRRLLETVLSVGISKFDVAPAYGNGIGERELSTIIQKNRKNIEINTKFGLDVIDYGEIGRYLFSIQRGFDMLLGISKHAYGYRTFEKEKIEESVCNSLKRLKTEYIDNLYMHEPLVDMNGDQFEEIMHEFGRLKERGMVRRIGIAGPKISIDKVPIDSSIGVIQTKYEDWYESPNNFTGVDRLNLYSCFSAYKSQVHIESYNKFLQKSIDSDNRIHLIICTNQIQKIEQLGLELR